MALAANVGTIARVPLRRGILLGKFTADDHERFQDDDVRSRIPKERFVEELRRAEKCRFLVKGPVSSMAQAALAFCLAHPAVSTVIPGARNARQMRENASASGIRLPEEDLKRLRELGKSGFAE